MNFVNDYFSYRLSPKIKQNYGFFKIIIFISPDAPVLECLKVTLLFVHFLLSPSGFGVCICVSGQWDSDCMCQNTNISTQWLWSLHSSVQGTDWAFYDILCPLLVDHEDRRVRAGWETQGLLDMDGTVDLTHRLSRSYTGQSSAAFFFFLSPNVIHWDLNQKDNALDNTDVFVCQGMLLCACGQNTIETVLLLGHWGTDNTALRLWVWFLPSCPSKNMWMAVFVSPCWPLVCPTFTLT